MWSLFDHKIILWSSHKKMWSSQENLWSSQKVSLSPTGRRCATNPSTTKCLTPALPQRAAAAAAAAVTSDSKSTAAAVTSVANRPTDRSIDRPIDRLTHRPTNTQHPGTVLKSGESGHEFRWRGINNADVTRSGNLRREGSNLALTNSTNSLNSLSVGPLKPPEEVTVAKKSFNRENLLSDFHLARNQTRPVLFLLLKMSWQLHRLLSTEPDLSKTAIHS